MTQESDDYMQRMEKFMQAVNFYNDTVQQWNSIEGYSLSLEVTINIPRRPNLAKIESIMEKHLQREVKPIIELALDDLHDDIVTKAKDLGVDITKIKLEIAA